MNRYNNNKITFRVFLVFLVFLFGKSGIAQTSISGKINDKETGEEMIAANIVVSKNGVFVQGETTDIDGNYSIRVEAGSYDMEISYTGYTTHKITGIITNAGKSTKVDVQILSGEIIEYPIIACSGCCRILLIQHDRTTTGKVINTSEDVIKNLPTRDINEIITISPGVSFTQ